MKYGVCILSLIPCREEPSDRSEMVTQLLFGDTYKVVANKKKWVKIRIDHDGYQGWIDRKQLHLIEDAEYLRINEATIAYSGELIALLHHVNDNRFYPIVMGCRLPGIAGDQNEFSIGEDTFRYEGEVRIPPAKADRAQLVEDALTFLNAPYLWGGKSPFGIDCSGFSQIIYRLNGIALPRDASQQARHGESLSFIEESEEGDLAFFDNEEGNIIHVGIMLSNNRIIHAAGSVRIDRIDHQGIFNNDIHDYSHKLRILKNFV